MNTHLLYARSSKTRAVEIGLKAHLSVSPTLSESTTRVRHTAHCVLRNLACDSSTRENQIIQKPFWYIVREISAAKWRILRLRNIFALVRSAVPLGSIVQIVNEISISITAHITLIRVSCFVLCSEISSHYRLSSLVTCSTF